MSLLRLKLGVRVLRRFEGQVYCRWFGQLILSDAEGGAVDFQMRIFVRLGWFYGVRFDERE